MTADETIKLALDLGDVLHMIDVPMRQEQEFEIGLQRTHPFASALWRVEENPALWRLKQIAIRFENAAAKALVNHFVHCISASLRLKAGLFTNN